MLKNDTDKKLSDSESVMDKSLDVDRLYWALSTLPQVGAALIAFIGFLVLDSMSKIEQRCKILEEHIRGWAKGFSKVLEKIGHPTEMGVRVIPFGKLVEIIQTLHSKHEINLVSAHEADLGSWQPLDNWRKGTRGRLRVFVSLNLFLTALPLVLIPFVENLAPYPLTFGIIWCLSVLLMVASTLWMLWRILFRPQP
ncbi:MAG: hypothetical protein ABIU05_02995 [Nitrospirales bacterium]